MQHWLKLRLRNKRILSFSIKLIRPHELVQTRSFLLLSGSVKLLLNFTILVNWKITRFIRNCSFLIFLLKRILVAQLPISCVFFMERKAFFFSFFNMKKSIWQNYELLILISLWKQSLGVALQKKVYYKKLF